MQKFTDILTNHAYPGRGIMLGRTADDKSAVIVYFIMGRSENSRNRVFEVTEDGIRTKAFDESKMTDPSLIIYHPVRVVGDKVVVTNGDQTDTIRDYLVKGEDMEAALETREFEPDGPNWTPRISGQLCLGCCDGALRYKLSILKSMDAEGSACTRHYFRYKALAGHGHFIHTYQENLDPLPSFHGEPREVEVTASNAKAMADEVWNALNADNKVSLFVRYIDLASGEADTVIINKHEED